MALAGGARRGAGHRGLVRGQRAVRRTPSRLSRCWTCACGRAGGCPVACPRPTTRWRWSTKGACTRATESRGAGELILFANDGDRLELVADEPSHVIVLAGEPIDEPIVQYGPFVMNTFDEIRQAIVDVEAGKFGPIPD